MSVLVDASPQENFKAAPLPKAGPCVVVILGATGDLTRRKLIPALYHLACSGCTSNDFEVLGIGRTNMTDADFRAAMRASTSTWKNTHDLEDGAWEQFASRLHYLPGNLSDPAFYRDLAARLDQMHQTGSSANHLFYASTPSSLAPSIVEGLGAAGLARSDRGWSRIILEKPFGHDLKSAKGLNEIVSNVFAEQDIYRIDHYLGKETVQNILVFRFGNSMFEPVWNRNYVEYVEITAAETLGVEGRAAFYEETGALRDMVANHLLQLLTLTAMEPPVAFDAEAVREQKVQVLRSIRPMTPAEVAQHTVRGQYGPGEIAGKRVPGYRDEPGVAPDSNTETFVAVRFYVNNWRWEGVPFYVRTGKRLGRPVTQISVHFKRTPQALFARTPTENIDPNVVILRIQPDEGISISFAAKSPGSHMQPRTVQMEFSYQKVFGADAPVAYETLLLDAMRGDATLFTRRDEVEAEWRIITPIEETWAQQPPAEFPNYASGGDGPEGARDLLGSLQHWCAITGQARS